MLHKIDAVGDLVPIVPCIQHLLLGVIVNLCGESIFVDEGQSWGSLRTSEGVVSVRQLALSLVVHIDRIKYAAGNETVPIGLPPKPCLPGGLLLDGQVHGVQLADHYDLLLSIVIVHCRVDDPETTLIHGKVDVRVTSPLPGRGVFIDDIVQEGPGSHVPHLQVILDDVLCEGPIVIEGTVVDNMACSNPVVRKFVEVGPTAFVDR